MNINCLPNHVRTTEKPKEHADCNPNDCPTTYAKNAARDGRLPHHNGATHRNILPMPKSTPRVFCSNYESSVPAKQRPRQTISPGHSAAAPRPSLTSHLKPNGLYSYTDRPGPNCLPSLAPGRPSLSTESRKGAYLSHALSSDAPLVPHPPHCTTLHLPLAWCSSSTRSHTECTA
jgi:hypothetical protein